MYCEAFRLDHIRCASLRLGDIPLLCCSEYSFRSSEHLNMAPSETSSSPTLTCSTPLLGELTRWSSSRETLPEASPPSSRGWTSRPPNSHCNWTSQFFQRNTYPRAVLYQGRQSGSTTPAFFMLEIDLDAFQFHLKDSLVLHLLI